MGVRAWVIASVLACVAMLLPVVPDGNPAALAVLTAALLCAIAVSLLIGSSTPLVSAVIVAPDRDRLRGRFLQQSRPGVPGRTRARAPGSGR